MSAKIKPDYSHRLATTGHLYDSIELIADRSLSVLTLLLHQFEDKDSTTVNHKIVYAALISVLCDWEDAKSLSAAHSQAEFAKLQEKIALVK